MTIAAIYARVSGARQKEEQTIGSQLAECERAAAEWGLQVRADWVFADEGWSGASLVRPALERLRDLVVQLPVEVVICYAPDRLARKPAYQTLLIDELAKAGSEVRFVKARRVETPEDEMLLQFQGMVAVLDGAVLQHLGDVEDLEARVRVAGVESLARGGLDVDVRRRKARAIRVVDQPPRAPRGASHRGETRQARGVRRE
jgi:hypothetical protein